MGNDIFVSILDFTQRRGSIAEIAKDSQRIQRHLRNETALSDLGVTLVNFVIPFLPQGTQIRQQGSQRRQIDIIQLNGASQEYLTGVRNA